MHNFIYHSHRLQRNTSRMRNNFLGNKTVAVVRRLQTLYFYPRTYWWWWWWGSISIFCFSSCLWCSTSILCHNTRQIIVTTVEHLPAFAYLARNIIPRANIAVLMYFIVIYLYLSNAHSKHRNLAFSGQMATYLSILHFSTCFLWATFEN